MTRSRSILPIIVLSQFFCTSIWFAGNAVLADIIKNTDPVKIGHISSAVQFGFITGTLVFALFSIGDRFSPSRIFLASAIVASASNFGVIYIGTSFEGLLALRFITGFFLAGIYPIGMKIVADHYKEGLGKSLGYLVGALVLGTALPHLLRAISFGMPWQALIFATSLMAITGGMLVGFFIPDGQFRIKAGVFKLNAIFTVFKSKGYRTVAFGYFGHNWELYAFWAFVPQLLTAYANRHAAVALNIPMLSFAIIASGSLACVISGYLSGKFDTKKLATLFLFVSCSCCIISPLLFYFASPIALVAVLVCWAMVAVADSPLFSKLMAQNAPAHLKGTALTIANCIGFSVTIFSIQLIGNLSKMMGTKYVYMFLAIGPLLGLLSLTRKYKNQVKNKRS